MVPPPGRRTVANRWNKIEIVSNMADILRRLRHAHRASNGLSPEEAERFVSCVYRATLRREPDEKGRSYWVQQLCKGLAPSVMMEQFLNCEEFGQQSSQRLFVPPGHFYSPIVDRVEAGRHLARIKSLGTAESVRGVHIDRAAMVQMWDQLLPFMLTCPFAGKPVPGFRYQFENPAYAWGDGIILHSMLRLYCPQRIIEIGSGWSSVCMADTIKSCLAGKCELTLIEPFPGLLHDLLGPNTSDEPIHILECGVQQVPLETFDALRAGDILFIDSTHVLRTGSDVCYELCEILPRLAPGVIVHFHDIFWPFEYPRGWVIDENRSWNELYAVRVLLNDYRTWRVLMFNDYMAKLERDRIAKSYPGFNQHTFGALWIERQ
jgi:predicted O-methyltransferase YrrM